MRSISSGYIKILNRVYLAASSFDLGLVGLLWASECWSVGASLDECGSSHGWTSSTWARDALIKSTPCNGARGSDVDCGRPIAIQHNWVDTFGLDDFG